MRGKRITNNTLLSNIVQSQREVGKFKGWIEIISKEKPDISKGNITEFKGKNQEKPEENQSLKKPSNFNLDREFIEKTHCFVRIYVISAISLSQLDSNSLSDPYIRIILDSNSSQDNSSEFQTDKTNCDFFKCFEFKSIFPGTSLLNVQIWDKDPFNTDELIGETVIDLENRFFSKKWRKLKQNIPIETRELFHPLSKINRGKIRLFIEILPVKEVILREIWDISPIPLKSFQIRVIIWGVEEVPNGDLEGVSDLYIVGNISGIARKTDVHFRAQCGKAAFNWRMIWDLKLPRENEENEIRFQVWDKDYVSSDDFAGEARWEFGEIVKEVVESENQGGFKEKKIIQFKVKMLIFHFSMNFSSIFNEFPLIFL